jgi:CHAT domain-containing protein/tetratricopeptide (TPR) repeat protein
MLNSRLLSRLSTNGFLLVLAGALFLPLSLKGQVDSAPQLSDQEASPQPSSGELPPAAQAQLAKLEDARKAAHAAGDAKAEVKTLGQIGDLYFRAVDFQNALDRYNQALAVARSANDDRQQAAALIVIARCYRGLAENQKALQSFQQALDLATASGNEAAQGAALIGLGNVNNYLGEKEKALAYYNQALPVLRKTGNRLGESTMLNNIGSVYSDLGERRKALEYYNQALVIRKELGARGAEAVTLQSIGTAYADLGEKQKALEYYNQALPIQREVNAPGDEAETLNGMGRVYRDLGKEQEALEYFNQALPLERQTKNHVGEANLLMNIGLIYSELGESEKALDYFNQALPIFRQRESALGQAKTLNNIGALYGNHQQFGKALEYYNQALPIFRHLDYRRGEANTLSNMGNMYFRLGDKQNALDYSNQALALAAIVSDPLLESQILIRLMVLQSTAQPGLAVFYGKQAINLLQQVRSNIQGLDEDLQKSFLVSKNGFYQGLAYLLIVQGRLAEAQQVLDLLKQQEYQDYVRGETANTLSPLTLTPAERQAEGDYQKSTAQLVSLGEQWAQLKKNTARTPEQEKQYQQLSEQLDVASKGLNDYYARLYELFGAHTDANKQVADVKGNVSALKQTIAKTPHTVALYTLVGSDRISIIVITSSATVAREFAIAEGDLNRKVAAFEQMLRNPSQDPRPLAQELYAVLIAPVKADLDQAGAQTLVWSLDGVLRYVPIAALYDGKQYVVEKYNTVTITPASIPHLNEKPDVSGMSTVAMGISQKYEEGLPALPAVANELNHVVRDPKVQGADGVLPGTILLNDKFTEKGMENLLGGQHTVVHIASHFVFKPGDDSQSYLLLSGKGEGGGGFHLTVADFRDNQQLTMDDTDLLTLSACETGMSGSASNGREVDGLGTTAQLKGAKAVISSLWSVNDASTGLLMGDFYKRWAEGAGSVTKVEALRQAQLDLLLGRVKPGISAGDRGSAMETVSPATPVLAGYAHPYYWAPFVLMGNWR